MGGQFYKEISKFSYFRKLKKVIIKLILKKFAPRREKMETGLAPQ